MASASPFLLTLPLSGKTVPFAIRRSAKALRCSCRVSAEGNIELVLPFSVPEAEGAAFLRSNALWIEKALKRTDGRKPAARNSPVFYPGEFDFKALNRTLKIRCKFLDAPWAAARADGGILTVSGNVLEPEAVAAVLGRFLVRTAEREFFPLLSKLSEETGLPVSNVSVRLQKTRWGSCSRRNSISLNATLLFTPPECVRYVMIHELCHTREMNHSAAFWRLVAGFVPDWKYRRSLLNRTKIPLLSVF